MRYYVFVHICVFVIPSCISKMSLIDEKLSFVALVEYNFDVIL